jgi:hypothetical protein
MEMSALGPGCVKTRLPTIVVKSSVAVDSTKERMIQDGVLRRTELLVAVTAQQQPIRAKQKDFGPTEFH